MSGHIPVVMYKADQNGFNHQNDPSALMLLGKVGDIGAGSWILG